MDTCQKRAFSETRVLLGFSIFMADRVIVANRRRGDALYAELGKWYLCAGLSSRTSA